MLQPGSFVSRMAAVAILAILLLAGYQLIVQPLIRIYGENKDRIVKSHELLQRYQALADERPALSERVADLDDDDSDEQLSGYLEGPSDALAAAQLQDLAAQMIEGADGDIRSAQILAAVEVDAAPALRRAGVKVRFAATIEGLASALYDLETAEPRLFIDQLIIASEKARRVGTKDSDDVKLDIRLDLFGYVRQTE